MSVGFSGINSPTGKGMGKFGGGGAGGGGGGGGGNPTATFSTPPKACAYRRK